MMAFEVSCRRATSTGTALSLQHLAADPLPMIDVGMLKCRAQHELVLDVVPARTAVDHGLALGRRRRDLSSLDDRPCPIYRPTLELDVVNERIEHAVGDADAEPHLPV